MKGNKSKEIVIILIIIMFILLIGAVAFAYFATDIFKSDKKMFFKYATQMSNFENGFIDSNLKQYFEKRKTTPYTDEGKFSVNIITENGQEKFENTNNFNISFSGQVDTANSKSMQDISLNYSDTVNFPFSYKKIGNTVGLQTKHVGSKFIAVETDNLDKLTEGSNLSIEGVTDGIENVQKLTKVELTQEDKNRIKDTYMSIIDKQLKEEQFSKVKEENITGYKLSLTGEEVKNVLINILETLKNDQSTLDKINEYLKTQKNSAKISASDIDDMIEEINKNTDFNDEKIEIIVYQQKGKTKKIVVSTNETKIEIKKAVNANETLYGIAIEVNEDDEKLKIYLNAKYDGIGIKDTIKENYELVIDTEEIQYKYRINNNITFTDSVNIEEFKDSNSMILTNYEQEQVSNFLTAVAERITQVNEQQMEELGLEEDEHPLANIIPSLGIYTSSVGTINQSANTMSEMEINTFNQKFEVYESTNQGGATVKGLLSTISLNNESAEDDRQIKEINFDGEEYDATEENITFIKGDIDTGKSYKIEFEKDQDTGIIYRVIISIK